MHALGTALMLSAAAGCCGRRLRKAAVEGGCEGSGCGRERLWKGAAVGCGRERLWKVAVEGSCGREAAVEEGCGRQLWKGAEGSARVPRHLDRLRRALNVLKDGGGARDFGARDRLQLVDLQVVNGDTADLDNDAALAQALLARLR